MTVPTFPTLPGLAFPVGRKPTWRTDKEESFSGIGVRYPTRNVPKWSYELSISALRSSTALPEWQALASFFNALYGANGLFQYNDPMDNAVTSQLFGEGDGVTVDFQLVRTGPPGGGTFTEPVYAPSTITAISIGTSPSTAYTLGDTGIITFSSAPANGALLTWSGGYNWLARFDEDVMEFSQFNYNLFELQKLNFTTELLG
jgi:uncharacterized protein (TIGR02217 family)